MYGLEWPSGHAIVEGVLSSDAHTVTRRLGSATGERLTAGLKVALDSSVYAGNPQQAVGLPFANVLGPDELGPMPARLIPARVIPARTQTWAIVVHGINGNREDNLRIAPTLHRAGLPTLVITYREDVGARRAPMACTTWD